MDDAYHTGANPQYGSVHQRQPYEHANGFQAQHYQEHAHEGTQTLPPIQAPQRPVLQHASHSYDAHYRPHGLPYGATTAPPYQSYYGHGVSQAPFHQGIPQYSHASYPTHTSQAGMSPMEYAAAAPHQNSLPILRPMPPNGFEQDNRGAVSAGDLASGRGNPPRPVVGSQGRRGILPSEEGRPPVSNSESDPVTKANFNPTKGLDGKYACPHCPKTYLHAKHLKRHYLRHTGDRPYSCALCNETFSRSDILKRHFQKCSVRRGNPTNATHLTGSQAHMKRQAAKKQDAAAAAAAAGASGTSNFSIVTPLDAPTYGKDGGGGGRSLLNYPSADPGKRYSDGPGGAGHSPLAAADPAAFSLPAAKREPASLPSSGGSTPVTSKRSGLSSASFTPEIPAQQQQPQQQQQPRGDGFGGGGGGGGGEGVALPHLSRAPPHAGEYAGWGPFDQQQQPRDGGPDHHSAGPARLAGEQQHDFMNHFFTRDGPGHGHGMHG